MITTMKIELVPNRDAVRITFDGHRHHVIELWGPELVALKSHIRGQS